MLIHREGNSSKFKPNTISNHALTTSCYYLIVQPSWCGLNYLSSLPVFYSHFLSLTGRTVGQLSLGYRCDSLEVIMAGVTEVGGTEAEKDSDRATVATLVFQEIRPMLWTHLQH